MQNRALAAGLFFSLVTALSIGALAVGCSDDEAPAVESTDAAPTADGPQRDAPREETGVDRTRATCLANCAEKHPTGKAKDDAIQQCWDTKCIGRCTDDEIPDGGVDGDGGPGDGGACVNPVDTEVISCDNCTIENCCAAWDGCFSDKDCEDFVVCTRGCPAE